MEDADFAGLADQLSGLGGGTGRRVGKERRNSQRPLPVSWLCYSVHIQSLYREQHKSNFIKQSYHFTRRRNFSGKRKQKVSRTCVWIVTKSLVGRASWVFGAN